MPQKRNHDFTERYPSIKAGSYKPMRVKDILTTPFNPTSLTFLVFTKLYESD